MQNKIEMYIHCTKCLQELPDGMSPSEYSRIECGFTQTGFQVWCMRCNLEIIEFEVEPVEEEVIVKERKELN